MAAKYFFRQNPTSLEWEYGTFKSDGITPNIELNANENEYRARWETVSGVACLSILNSENLGELPPFKNIPITDIASDLIGTPYASRTAFENANAKFFNANASVLKTLEITANVSEAVILQDSSISIQVETSDASTITFLRSSDGVDFSVIPDISLTVNNTVDEINLVDFKTGQYLKVSSTGTMTSCKVRL